MSTASCGHEVRDGIMVTYKSVDREGENCSVHACYCARCALDLHRDRRLEGDLNQLIALVRNRTLSEIEDIVDEMRY